MNAKENVRTSDNGITDVEVVVLLVPTDFRDEDGQIVIGASLDADSQAPVTLSLQSQMSELERK